MHFLNLAADAQCGYFEPQRIAGNYRTAESGIVDAAKERYLVLTIVKFAKCKYRPYLSQGFDLQNTRHHRCSRKVTDKELLVRRHLLYPDNTNTWLQFDDLINQ